MDARLGCSNPVAGGELQGDRESKPAPNVAQNNAAKLPEAGTGGGPSVD